MLTGSPGLDLHPKRPPFEKSPSQTRVVWAGPSGPQLMRPVASYAFSLEPALVQGAW